MTIAAHLLLHSPLFTNFRLQRAPAMAAVTAVLLQLATTSTIVGFTSSQSSFRLIGLGLHVLAACSQVPGLVPIENPVVRAFCGAASVFQAAGYIDVGILSRWAYEAGGPTSSLGGLRPDHPSTWNRSEERNAAHQANISAKSKPTVRRRLQFGWSISLQSRFPRTRWPVKNIPPFSYKDPSYVPSRASFTARNTLKCLFYIAIVRAVTRVGDPAENPIQFDSDRISLISRLNSVSETELSTRFGAVLGYFALHYFVVDLLYSLLGTLTVALRISSVEDWPPVFGSMSDAWSIRQFWG